MKKHRIISELSFDSDGVAIQFVTPSEDVKKNGLLVNHSILIPLGDDYDTEIQALVDAAMALLDDALEDFEVLGPPEEREREDEDHDDDDD